MITIIITITIKNTSSDNNNGNNNNSKNNNNDNNNYNHEAVCVRRIVTVQCGALVRDLRHINVPYHTIAIRGDENNDLKSFCCTVFY